MVDPDSKLEEELIIRPTSEAIIWNTYKGWIQSYRDLPLLINQWANVVRWEMRTRCFYVQPNFYGKKDTLPMLLQPKQLQKQEQMLEVYADFAENYMAMPVIKGVKSPNERFAGAVDTYCIEALNARRQSVASGYLAFSGAKFCKSL